MEKDLVRLQETPTSGKGDQDTTRFDDVTLRSNWSSKLRGIRYDGGYDITLQRGQSGKLDTAASSYSQSDYALYLNTAYDLLKEKLTLQGSVRAAHNDRYTAPLVPAFNLLFRPTDKWQVRASYSQGFRAPTLKELYLRFVDQNHEIIGNPSLKAEQSQNWQLSLSRQHHIASGWYFNAVASGYYNDVRDGITLINPTTDPTSLRRIYGNLTRQRNAIGNLQVDAMYKTLRLSAGYGYNHTFGEVNVFNAFSVQEATATATWTWRTTGLGISAFYKYTGPGRLLVADADGRATYGGSTIGFHMLDASLQRSFWNSRITLLGGVKNILDVRTINGSGAVTTGAHGSGGAGAPLPRRAFAQLSWTFR
jgi:outer membrane receptor for ferrienterochelin and colicins